MVRGTALYADPFCKQHLTGEGAPEQPARYDAVIAMLEQRGIMPELQRLPQRTATDDELALIHSRDYLAVARADVENGSDELSTGDTNISAASYEAAARGVGGALQCVDAVLSGSVRNAFAVVRPPGHHATPTRGMGFCLFNNIAIAARYAQRQHGIERALIFDWDVHHGNGTQDAFYEDPTVFFCSTHQSPWYPGTGQAHERGAGKGEGTTLNCPFPAGAGREEILGALRDRLLPLANEFRPDLVLVSAGFDSRRGDPLGRFLLDDADFEEMTLLLMELADKHAGGRVVSLLEGGYNLQGLANAAAAHVRTLEAA